MAAISRAPMGAAIRIARPSSSLSQHARLVTQSARQHRSETNNQQRFSLHPAVSIRHGCMVADDSNQLLRAARFRCSQAINFPTYSRRQASTKSSASSAQPQDTVVAANPASSSKAEILTWNEFLRLRKIRRRFNLAASTTVAAASFVGGLGWLSEQNLEQLGSHLFGMDPLFVMGLSALGFAGAGWIVGPFIGSAIWRASYSNQVKGMAAKERDFFHRIKRYRVDPTQSSVQNPTPDYYGEKITSVQGYRQWLKDQRAFNRKRQVTA